MDEFAIFYNSSLKLDLFCNYGVKSLTKFYICGYSVKLSALVVYYLAMPVAAKRMISTPVTYNGKTVFSAGFATYWLLKTEGLNFRLLRYFFLQYESEQLALQER